MSTKTNDENDREWNRLFALWTREIGAHVIEATRHQIARYPKCRARWLLLGVSLSELSIFDEAQAALRTAEQLSPPSHRHFVWFKRGHLIARKGNHRTARMWYERAIAAAPRRATYLILFGNDLFERGEFEEAKECQRRAVKAGNGATEEANRALELDPSYESAEMLAGDLREAVKARDARRSRSQANVPD